ncbi:MAG: hypothetical protein NC311_19680, partial [Muribaculaceae bacterium]|nr:hypothetical protein [Muribaculaceae bacterium]
ARLLAAMLEKLPGDTVELRRQGRDPQISLLSGDAAYTVPVFERGSFPKPVPPFPEDTVKVSGIPSMARRTVFATSPDGKGERPLLKCVNLMFTRDGLRAAGSDGTCIITASGDSKCTGNASLLLPAASLNRLARMCEDTDEFRVGTTGKTVAFLREDFIYSARLMEGEYIDTEQLAAAIQPQFQVLTDVADLRGGLERVISVDPDGKAGLLFDGQRLTFQCRGVYGNASASIAVIPFKGISRGESWYLTSQLESCLRALSGTVKLGTASGGMLVLETEDALYFQTATRAPAAEAEKKTKKAAPKAA